MNNKNTGMIATIASVVLCGCPGLFMCIFGAVTASGNMPYSTEVNGISSSGTMPAGTGFAMLCFSLIFIIIPIAVGFFTLRKKPEAASVANDDATPTA
ncbi:MAG: hypothetical protein U0Z26_05095 [Anaerolineales bacterium]